ncbi:spermatogenesis-associated protein 20 [Radiomyces spectabilis]|uniref:spermatogenesis-associated protein 20 n=1 Tax=Radiomyces spectabilis TaxID=64574 RepID=UPI0022206653|nr:spermatogenesis-associated protein 20 [Radiomyces spectabilis]KAI8391400.1 spermatogenesis-associated protein 20 [Radiomyces spectabilis]
MRRALTALNCLSIAMQRSQAIHYRCSRPLLRVLPPTSTVASATRLSLPSSHYATQLRYSSTAHKYTNRLVYEKSPYLLQHAHNPVDWYPWGEKAFAKAKAENKPIFLSIGYSTCHWCHVMEHESFENEEIAKIMNDSFVNVKVDREENPGVDKFYMTYVLLTAGRGGWPMSVFLTPDLAPFFGATYFPPEDRQGMAGFKTLLKRVASTWLTSPDKLRDNGEETVRQLRDYIASGASSSPDVIPPTVPQDAYKNYSETFDQEYGGFAEAPKFPQPVQLNFLLNYYGYLPQKERHTDNAKKALDMALFTLKRIAAGGIHDHVGGGFHRYSTDKYWHVPHFEKMLYDQAQLLSSYSMAYQITKDPAFAETAKDIVNYVTRDLQHPEGGFYSAEDADSLPTKDAKKKLEGAFCVWEASELESILGKENADIFSRHYGVQEHGNVNPMQDPHNELEGKNVLTEEYSLDESAKAANTTPEKIAHILEDCRNKLWKHRQQARPKPHLDDKILTSWNGLMISGLAQAGVALNDPTMLTAATNAASFIMNQLYDKETNILLRSYREGPSSIEGFLDDYSFMTQALIDLYEATFDEKWIQWAYDLQEKQNELFYDEDHGGYFSVQEKDKSILVRLKEEQDGAEPSPNGVSLKNLIRLGTLLEDQSYVTKAQDTLAAFNVAVTRFPYAVPSLVTDFQLMTHGTKQIVLAGSSQDKNMKTFEKLVSQVFMPNKIIAKAQKGGFLSEKNATIAQIANNQDSNKPRAYVCQNFTCGLPIDNVDQLRKEITY